MKWLRKKLRKWLGIETLTTLSFEADQRLIDSIYNLAWQITDIINQSFMGVDLCREQTQVMLIVHSPRGDGWKLIADTSIRNGTYMEMVRMLRPMIKEHNVRYFAADGPPDCPPLRQRVMPGTDYGSGDEMTRRPTLFAHTSIAALYNSLLGHNKDCPPGASSYASDKSQC